MNNEMKFEKNGLLIPNGALEELGLAGISLSAWLGQDHILLMPQEMTAEQLPENIRPLLMLSGCCPSALAQLLEEGDIVYAAE